ncbi:Pre-mRNA-processing factor 39 [Hordeum vulgare]|nr:Pre-mRNA-processing factor 39 [Hordeum vulgare]
MGKSPVVLVGAFPSASLKSQRTSAPGEVVLGTPRSLPYPVVTLPHDWHLDQERIPVPAVPRSVRALAEEVRRRRDHPMPDHRHNPVYAINSLDWEAWFAWECEEQRRRGVRDVVAGAPSPLVVREEDQEAEAAYKNALAAVLLASEEEARVKEKEKEACHKQLTGAIALFAAGDCIVPPQAPPAPVELGSLVLRPELYTWNGVACEWVSAPPVWLSATPKQEAAYLEHSRQWRCQRRTQRPDGSS